jgi:copper(I)-binding protein
VAGHRLATRGALAALTIGVVALTGCGSSGSDAKSSGSGTVKLENAWSRATAASQTSGVVYLVVANDSDADVVLTGASVPADIATDAQMHETMTESTSSPSMDDMPGMTTMQEVTSVRVRPHHEVTFEPGGYHIMLTDLEKPLATGDTFTITLHRRGGADLTTTVTVEDA